tara:strand:+ start:737 stop:1165 length:429 start_codon:yes stop_codon:yes gene_type:complete
MIDVESLFNLFPEDDKGKDSEKSTFIDFKNSPIYWLGMYKKIVLNHINFNKKILKFFKSADVELDVEDMKEAGELFVYTKAWVYVENIDIKDEKHIEAIKYYSDEFLDTSLELGISYFQEIEEYEKCAHLLLILKKSQEFLI